MRSSSKVAVLAFAGVLVASTVWAQSLEEKQRRAKEEKDFQASVAAVNTACGATLTSKIDWSGLGYDVYTKWERGPAYYCDLGAGGIKSVCNTPDGKAAVQKQIKSVTCGGSDPQKIDLTGGNLTISVSTKNPHIGPGGSTVHDYLMKNLK